MMPNEINQTGLSHKIIRLIKELKKAKHDLKNEEDKLWRSMLREQVYDLTAELAWELIECDRYEEGYAFARTLPWRTHAQDRYLCEGTSLMELGKTAEARALLEAGVKKYPEFVPLLVSLGNCHTLISEHLKALEYQERALQLEPRDRKILFNKAVSLYNLGFYENTQEILHRIIKRHPRDPWSHSLIGHCYNQTGYPEDARKHFQIAIACGYWYVDAHEGLFLTFYEQGMRNDAINVALEGIRRFPDQDPELYMNLAATYHEMGWTKEAIDVIRQAIVVFPEDQELKEWLAELENDMNDPDQGDEIKEPKILLVLNDKKKERMFTCPECISEQSR